MGCPVIVGVEEGTVGGAELARVHRVPWPVSERDFVLGLAPLSRTARSRSDASVSSLSAPAVPWLRPCLCADGCPGVIGGEGVDGSMELARVLWMHWLASV